MDPKRLVAAALLLLVSTVVMAEEHSKNGSYSMDAGPTQVNNAFTSPSTIKTVKIDWDPVIQGMVDKICADSISSNIRRMQRFYNRCALSCSSYAASQWLLDKYSQYATAYFDSFYLEANDTGYERNVVAAKAGYYLPEREYIICGHFDTVGPDSLYRPGADDNASGVAMTLEAARVLCLENFKYTYKYIGFAAEEGWIAGSRHYAAFADSMEIDIGCVFNMDMVGFMGDQYADVIVGGVSSFVTLYSRAANIYAPDLLVNPDTVLIKYDDIPFREYGYPTLCCNEKYSLDNPSLLSGCLAERAV